MIISIVSPLLGLIGGFTLFEKPLLGVIFIVLSLALCFVKEK